jgi:hypothetical protein
MARMYICVVGGERMKVNVCLLYGVALALLKGQDFVLVGVLTIPI